LGVVAPSHDSQAIADSFEKIYRIWKEKGEIPYFPNHIIKERYSRERLTQQLATIIQQVTKK